MKNSTGIFLTFIGAAAGGLLVKKTNRPQKDGSRSNKFVNYFHILDQWMTLKEKGKNASEFFRSNGFETIAIYGMGIMGRHLYEDIKDTDIDIAYAIDRNERQAYGDMELKTTQEELPEVDAVIVTPTFDFENVEKQLKEKLTCPIISLEEVISASLQGI